MVPLLQPRSGTSRTSSCATTCPTSGQPGQNHRNWTPVVQPERKYCSLYCVIIIHSVPSRVILRRVRCPSLSIRHSGALNRTGRGQDSDSLILKVYSASPGRRRTAADTGFARGGWSEEPARSVQPLPRVETGSLTASEAPCTSSPSLKRVTRLLHRPGPLNHLLPSGKGSDGTPGSEDDHARVFHPSQESLRLVQGERVATRTGGAATPRTSPQSSSPPCPSVTMTSYSSSS